MYLDMTAQDCVLALTNLLYIVDKNTQNRLSVISKTQPNLNSDLKLNHRLKIDRGLKVLQSEKQNNCFPNRKTHGLIIKIKNKTR